MSQPQIIPSLQDYSLIKNSVEKICDEKKLDAPSIGFMFFALEHILGLQEDEAEDAITDTKYLFDSGKEKGHDRGIDALYIQEEDSAAIVHLFNFKYTDIFKKTTNHFPSSEIDKIDGFLSALMQQDEELKHDVNNHLFSKVTDV